MTGAGQANGARGARLEPTAGNIACPAFVKHRAAELWNEYAPALIAMRTLTIVDVPNFACWCVLPAS